MLVNTEAFVTTQDGPSFLSDPLRVVVDSLPHWIASPVAAVLEAPAVDTVVGPLLVAWLSCCLLVGWIRGDAGAVVRFNLRLLGWALSGVAAALWLPVALALRRAGRNVPVVGLGLIDLVGRTTPVVGDPAADSIDRVETVNPAPVPGGHPDLEQWHVLGRLREGNSVGVLGGPGSAKNAAIVDYAIRDHLLRSRQNLILVAPKAATAEIALSYARKQDRVFYYSWHPGDERSSALDLFRDAERAGGVAGIVTDDPRDQAHWREQAASCLEVLARVLPVVGEHPSLIRMLDILSTRQALAGWRRRVPILEGIADEPKEWNFIRSGARKYLRPLMFRLGVRRVHSATRRTLTPTYAPDGAAAARSKRPPERPPGRDIVILRPRPGADEAEQRLIRAALDAEYRKACEAGDAGGPGVRVIVDEAASYMDLGSIPEYQELGRGSRTMLMYVVQSTRQLVARLGREEALQLFVSTDVLCAGWTKDELTAQMIETASGMTTVHYAGPRQRGEPAGRVEHAQRPRVLKGEILAMQKGEFAVWDARGVHRVRVPKRRYYYLQRHPAAGRLPHPKSLAREEDYALDPIEVLEDHPGEVGPGPARDRGESRGPDDII